MPSNTILIVDDEKNVLHTLKSMLTKEGYDIKTETNPLKAINEFSTDPVPVVISDLKMPGMDGISFFKKIKEKNPETVRIIFSGQIDLPEILEAINQGEIFRYISKPWKHEDLISSIKQSFVYYSLNKQKSKLIQKLEIQNNELEELNSKLKEMVNERTHLMQLAKKILKKIPLPILGTDPEGKILFANEAMKTYLPGLEEGNVFSETIPKIFPEKMQNLKICPIYRGPMMTFNTETTSWETNDISGWILTLKETEMEKP